MLAEVRISHNYPICLPVSFTLEKDNYIIRHNHRKYYTQFSSNYKTVNIRQEKCKYYQMIIAFPRYFWTYALIK